MVILGSDPLELQNSLDKLGIYCDKWGLEVNVDKTKIMVFRNRDRVPADNCWNYKGQTIEIVDDFNYLGVVFSYTGNFNSNISALVGKGLKALNTFVANVNKYCFKPKTFCQLSDAFVGSILNYSCEVWGLHKK